MTPLAGMAIATIASGLMNQQSQNQQMQMQRDAQNIINNVPLPILKEYNPELYQQIISILPEAETAVNLGPSQMGGISLDPKTREAQMNALAQLQQIGAEGGMTATDRARLAQIQAENDAALRGQQGAIMQNLATRGMGGGMSELVARQLATQGAANRQAQQGLDVKAQAEQRALDAIMRSGQLGGQIGGQDFEQAAAKARAADEIARFNAQNMQGVQQRNVGARNAAQEWNAQQAQNIASQNVGLKNQAQQYNLNLPQQEYANRMARATGQSQGLQQQANLAAEQARANQQFLGGLMQTGAQYYGGMQNKKPQGDTQNG